MGKIIRTFGVLAVGFTVAVAVGEAATPGSGAKTVNAVVTAGDSSIQGAGELTNTGVQVAIPVVGNAVDSARNSGVFNSLLTPDTTATAPGAVPPAAVPPAATPQQ